MTKRISPPENIAEENPVETARNKLIERGILEKDGTVNWEKFASLDRPEFAKYVAIKMQEIIHIQTQILEHQSNIGKALLGHDIMVEFFVEAFKKLAVECDKNWEIIFTDEGDVRLIDVKTRKTLVSYSDDCRKLDSIPEENLDKVE